MGHPPPPHTHLNILVQNIVSTSPWLQLPSIQGVKKVWTVTVRDNILYMFLWRLAYIQNCVRRPIVQCTLSMDDVGWGKEHQRWNWKQTKNIYIVLQNRNYLYCRIVLSDGMMRKQYNILINVRQTNVHESYWVRQSMVDSLDKLMKNAFHHI